MIRTIKAETGEMINQSLKLNTNFEPGLLLSPQDPITPSKRNEGPLMYDRILGLSCVN